MFDLEVFNAAPRDLLQFEDSALAKGKNRNIHTNPTCVSFLVKWDRRAHRLYSDNDVMQPCWLMKRYLCHLDTIHFLSCEWDATGEIIKKFTDTVC